MNVLPQAMALANIHIGTMAGKLNGVMPATTPSGWRIWYTSIPVLTCSEKPPLSRCGMPVANSRFSRPRATSPSASVRTLPCSRVRCAAISSRCCSTRLRIRNMISVRRLMRGGAPGGKRRVGGGNGRVDLLDRREVDLSRDLAGGGVVDRPASAAACPATRAPLIQWLTRSSPADATSGWGSAICVMALRSASRGDAQLYSAGAPASALSTGLDRCAERGVSSPAWSEPQRTCALCGDPIDSGEAWMEADDEGARIRALRGASIATRSPRRRRLSAGSAAGG